MRRLTYQQMLKAIPMDIARLKVLRQRGHAAFAFGRENAYEVLFHTELDAVAGRLNDVLAEALGSRAMKRNAKPRARAAQIVRDQWGVWSRVVAVAEADHNVPAFFYVVEGEDKAGKRVIATLGSRLDSRDSDNLRSIGADLYKKTGVIPRHFAVVEMQSVLADVRRNAQLAGFDLSDPFLPPYGSEALEELLKPYDDAAPDRAHVATTAGWMKVRAAGDRVREHIKQTLQ